MPRLVISTVGTSILTNQLNLVYEADRLERLQETANYSASELSEDVDVIIQDLTQQTKDKLYLDPEENVINPDSEEVKQASAELNGIYGLYEEDLSQGQEDIHWLITTHTAQGQVSAEIVRDFLIDNQLTAYIYTPPELSTASTEKFSNGIYALLKWIYEMIPRYYGYQICFNLVGGFKALQGYATTIGMFYAHEIIYIFEGSNELIKIPRLPIEIKKSEVEPYKVLLAMMDSGELLTSWEETKKVPLEWVLVVESEMTLSTWGQLIWNQCKDHFLSQDKPLKFPKIEYTHSFLDDYKSKPSKEKVILQEKLARAACLLNNHTDGISAMKQDGIFRLRRYQGKHKDIDHFDLPEARRVSCLAKEGQLYLRHYGEHDYVNDNP
ncbi:MAG: putative CRISPR-associated protein [Coleofasciculus sp. A1-SPW-01]|uniref:putative CRISPR-associated protein n=1 Tax=Coleofasciculus sp. A1-SPW-01 TaxID=3070819 RepID=UPI0032F76FAF